MNKLCLFNVTLLCGNLYIKVSQHIIFLSVQLNVSLDIISIQSKQQPPTNLFYFYARKQFSMKFSKYHSDTLTIETSFWESIIGRQISIDMYLLNVLIHYRMINI